MEGVITKMVVYDKRSGIPEIVFYRKLPTLSLQRVKNQQREIEGVRRERECIETTVVIKETRYPTIPFQ